MRSNEVHDQHPCQLAQREKDSTTQKRKPAGWAGEKRKARIAGSLRHAFATEGTTHEIEKKLTVEGRTVEQSKKK
jgi:hypothetical protein